MKKTLTLSIVFFAFLFCLGLPMLQANNQKHKEVEFRVFPNPSEGKFTVEVDPKGNQQTEVSVVSLIGQRVFVQQLESPARIDIDLQNHPKGVYFVQIQSETETLTRRLVIR
ncbi:MAG: T9SS type A sorting domain-containing protein [Bacteroidota bacterium]